MPRMWEKGAGWVNVPDEKVEELYLTGNYAFPEDTPVSVRLPNGLYSQVTPAQFSQVLNAGGGYDTAGERASRAESERRIAQRKEDEEEYGDWGSSLAAGALGVARGVLTEPLADALATTTNLMTKEDIEKHEQVNPGWLGTGEVGGFMGAVLLSGAGRAGAGLAAKGTMKGQAQKILGLSPAALTVKGGAKLETGVASLLNLGKWESGGMKRLGVAAAGGAAGAAEATAWSGATILGEELLGDSERTSSEIMRELKTFGILGGALGGSISLALATGTGLAKSLQAIERVGGAPISKKSGQLMDRLSEALGAGDYTQLQKFRDPAYLRKVLDVEDHIDVATVEVTHLVDDIITTFEDVSKFAKGSLKKERMYKEVAPEQASVTVEAVAKRYAEIRAVLVEVGSDSTTYKSAAAKEFLEALDSSVGKINAELAKRFGDQVKIGPKGIASGWSMLMGPHKTDMKKWADFQPWLFNHLDDFKKIVGSKTFVLKDFPSEQVAMNTHGKMTSVYHLFRDILEDEKFWGKTAASMQREVNAPFSTLLDLWPQFNRAFAKKVGKVYRSDVEAIRRYLKSRAGMEEIAQAPESIRTLKMRETFEAFEAFVLSVRTHYNPNAGANIVKRMQSAGGSIRALDETLNGAKALRRIASESGGGSLPLRLLGVGGGWQAGGPAVGVTAGLLSEAVMNPARAIRIRGAIQKIKTEAAARLNKSANDSVRRIFKDKAPLRKGRPQKKFKQPWLRRLHILAPVTPDEDTKSRSKIARQAQDTAQAIATISQSPDRVANMLSEGLAIIDGAPKLQESIRQRTIAVMTHINQNLPTGMHKTTDMLTGDTKFTTTDVAAAEYNTMVETANDWLTTVTDAFAELRVTPGMMKIAKIVDPEGVEEWTAQIHDGIIQSGKKVPPGMYGQLSIVLDLPVSPFYSGSVVQILQNLHTAADEKEFDAKRPSVIKGRARDERSGTQAMTQPALSVV